MFKKLVLGFLAIWILGVGLSWLAIRLAMPKQGLIDDGANQLYEEGVLENAKIFRLEKPPSSSNIDFLKAYVYVPAEFFHGMPKVETFHVSFDARIDSLAVSGKTLILPKGHPSRHGHCVWVIKLPIRADYAAKRIVIKPGFESDYRMAKGEPVYGDRK